MNNMISRLVLGAATLFLAAGSIGALAADENEGEEPKDALGRSKAKDIITACADPYDYPHALQNGDPPGFDVEILRAIAKRSNMRIEMYWVSTAGRGGTSKAFRTSILAKRCDIFLGLSDSGDDDMLMNKMQFTHPYIGMGYVLVTQGKAAQWKTFDEIREANFKVGVAMSTPMDDFLFTNKVPRELFLDNRRMMGSMQKGEIDAGMMWSTALGVARLEFPKAQFRLADGFVPLEGLRFNGAWAIRKDEKALMKFINEGIDELLANGKIREIVESYGVPFFSPFSS